MISAERSKLESVLARALRPFARVEPGEAVTALLMTATVFLLLTSYYLLKTAREPLILLHGGAEVKAYAAAGQSLLLIPVVRAYAVLAERVRRMRLLAIVYLFFASNLLVFATLAQAQFSLGVPFYLWVGVFNVTAIAQFWSFANDIYNAEQGKRLFAILGIGSSVGAVAGAKFAKQLAGLGPQGLMLTAAAILVLCVLIFAYVDRRERAAVLERRSGVPTPSKQPDAPLAGREAFKLLLQDRYLMGIAWLTFLLNCVNTNGEYILDRTLLAAVDDASANGIEPAVFVASFKADYFEWVNIIGVLLQLFVVSRVLKYVGLRRSLYVPPAVAFVSYGIMLAAPVLALIRIGKVAENSIDYSLQNTARQALFLVTSRSEKYVGKAVIDTFVVRVGDVFSAALVWLFGKLALPVQAFAALNLGLVAVWFIVVLVIGKEHRRRSALEGEQVAEAAQ